MIYCGKLLIHYRNIVSYCLFGIVYNMVKRLKHLIQSFISNVLWQQIYVIQKKKKIFRKILFPLHFFFLFFICSHRLVQTSYFLRKNMTVVFHQSARMKSTLINTHTYTHSTFCLASVVVGVRPNTQPK